MFAVKGAALRHATSSGCGTSRSPLANFFASGVLGARAGAGPGPVAAAGEPPLRRRGARRLPGGAARARPSRPPIARRAARRQGARRPSADRRPRTTGHSATRWSSAARPSPYPRPTPCCGGTPSPRCYADTAGRWPQGRRGHRARSATSGCTATASSTPAATPTARSTSGPSACRGWARAGQDVFFYFDNDMKGYAPHDAHAPDRPPRLLVVRVVCLSPRHTTGSGTRPGALPRLAAWPRTRRSSSLPASGASR